MSRRYLPLRYRIELTFLEWMMRFAGWAVYLVAFIVAMFIGGWSIPAAAVFVLGVMGGVFVTAYNRKRDADPDYIESRRA